MRLYKKTLKLFCTSPAVIIPYILLLVANNIILYRLLMAFADNSGNPLSTPLFFMQDISYTCFLAFIFYVFISFEFMRKIKEASLEETLSVSGIQGMGIYGFQILVLWTAALVQTLNVSIYMVIGYHLLEMPHQYIREIASFVWVDVLLLSFASIGIGVVLSKLKGRLWGYGAIIGLVFFAIPGTENILLSWQRNYHIPFFLLRDFICLLQPDFSAFPDSLYGLPLEWYRQAAMLFWILLSILLLSWKILCRKRRVRWFSGIVLAVCITIMGYGVLDKGSVLLMKGHPESSLEDTSQYNRSNPAMEKEADFSVSSYAMDFSMEKEMTAEVTLSIRQDKALPEYLFTLYHSYEILHITDGSGNELPFRRENDYVWVDNKNLSPIETLHFYYKGHSPTFYSNSKACFLPGFFPYYPKAGGHTVYDFGFVNAGSTKADYKIRVEGLRSPVFSNLKENGGVLVGTADNALLVSGYCTSTDVGGVTCLYYPFQKSCMENIEYMLSGGLEEKMVQLYQFLGIGSIPERSKKMLVTIPDSLAFNNALNTYYDCGDYILFNGQVEPYEILKAHTKAEGKEEMKSVFFSVMPGSDMDMSVLMEYRGTVEPDDYSYEMELYDTFIQKMKELGVRYTAQKTYQYLINAEDKTDALVFLKQLK